MIDAKHAAAALLAVTILTGAATAADFTKTRASISYPYGDCAYDLWVPQGDHSGVNSSLHPRPNMPPANKDHCPAAPFSVYKVSPQLAAEFCRVPAAYVGFACTAASLGAVIIRDDLNAADEAKVLRHEIGHLNGWVHPEFSD